MVDTRVKVHNFVGMHMTFKGNGTVEIMMKDYITEYFEAFSEPMDKV